MWKAEETMEILINSNTIIGFAGCITAIGVLIGLVRNYFKQIDKWNGYDKDIHSINTQMQDLRNEQYMQTKVLFAVLDGLHQLNCNGEVTKASGELSDYLNKTSHKQ